MSAAPRLHADRVFPLDGKGLIGDGFWEGI